MKCGYGLISRTKDIKVPLKEIQTNVNIKGFIANVESTLTYQNNESDPVEAQFVFPMDDHSAVYKFEAEIEGRHIVAECQEKQQAKETYDDAIASGQTAMMMSEDDQTGDIFEIMLGNLPPKTEAKLTLAYAMELPLESDGAIVFSLPSVLNPRYTPAGSSPTKSEVVPCVPYNSEMYTLTFTAEINGKYKIQSVKSKQDKLKVDMSEDSTHAQVSLAEAFKFDHDIALEIRYEASEKPEILLEKKLENGNGMLKEDVLMLNFYPEFPDIDVSEVKKEYIFIIDRSGSMGGDRINKAKETLMLLLKSLPQGCMFNIVGFGSSFTSLFDSSELYDESNLKKALKHQKSIKADLGGTEILQPLTSVYSKKLSCNSRQLFLLTDGQVSNTREVIALAQKNANTTRIFTFGIGEGVSTSLVQNMASVTGGKATFVKDSERLQSKVMSALKCAMQPAVTDIKLEWKLPNGLTALTVPTNFPPVFKGEKLILYSILIGQSAEGANMESSLMLKGNVNGKKIEHVQKFDMGLLGVTDALAPVHRLAAKAQIKELENEDSESGYYGQPKNKDKIVLLSTSANIISQHTAFVGIDKERGQIIEGQSSRITVPRYESGGDLIVRGLCRLADVRACGLYEECQAGSMSKSYYSSSSKRRSKGFSLRLPKFSFFSRKKCKPRYDSVARSASAMSYEADEDDSYEADIDVDRAEKLPKSNDGKMMELINLQEFNGSWKLTKPLAEILGKSVEFIQKENGLKDDVVWATALAIAWLQTKQSSKKDEWELIEKKALSWLSGQNLQGKSVDEAIQMASATLMC